MKTHTTSSLFYKKFPYKLILSAEWAPAGAYLTEKDLDDILNDKKSLGYLEKIAKKHPLNSRKIIQFIKGYPKSEIRTRVEGRAMSIFFQDRVFLDTIRKEFGNYITEFYEPPDDDVLKFMMTNKKTEVRYTLTHGCRYKVFIKACHDDTLMARENFINFVKKNPKEFHISQRVEHKLLSPKPYIYGSCYFFVSDDRYLLITQMMLQPIIKDTVKIITTNDINQGTAA